MKIRAQIKELLLPIFVTPMLPGVCYGISGLLSPEASDGAVAAFVIWGAVGYVFSLYIVFIVGAPLFLLFRHFNLAFWWASMLVGGVAGAIATTILHLGPLPVFCLLGSGSALLFWFLAQQFGAQQGTPADVHASRGRA